ncbi:MAG: hypothetical protein WC061_00740 [Melioribacteraceae bacterium]
MKESKRKIYLITSGIILLAAVIFISSGSGMLTYKVGLLFDIHLGTLTSWIIFINLPAISYLLVCRNKTMGTIMKIFLVLGILWLPVSIILAGNTSLIFTENSFTYMKQYSGLIAGSSVVAVVHLIISRTKKYRKKEE